MEIIFSWYAIGFVSTLVAIYLFRYDGTTARRGELYLAVIGPLFGPIVTILLFIDLLRRP